MLKNHLEGKKKSQIQEFGVGRELRNRARGSRGGWGGGASRPRWDRGESHRSDAWNKGRKKGTGGRARRNNVTGLGLLTAELLVPFLLGEE